MNKVFRKYLCNFFLVLFDDILIYSRTLIEHLKYLDIVFNILAHNHLYAKGSKCGFSKTSIEYLGHINSSNGIRTDPAKIQDIQEWLVPTSLKKLHGFLSLASLYQRLIYINFYGIDFPLVDLIKELRA